jgi:hypothetical protein
MRLAGYPSTDLTAPKFDFRSSPESGLKSDIASGPVRATNGLMRRSKRHLQSPILTAQEQACFASSGAQKRSINGHFAVIFEKPRVAVQAQNFCFKSPILRPL